MGARLIHLNGPPGIGKSTLAALWVDRHPGSLNLDIDALQRMVGGWSGPDIDTHAVLEPVVLAMAWTYLAGRRDVIVPQYMASPDRIESFMQIAVDNDAQFVEIVLVTDESDAITRFEERTDEDAWAEHVRALVTERGGAAHLSEMYGRLQQTMRSRPHKFVIESRYQAVEATYALLDDVLTRNGHQSPPRERSAAVDSE